MDNTWNQINSNYKNTLLGTEGKIDPTLELMLATEPDIVTSMMRNIGYHADPNFTEDSGGAFDAVFKAIIVVRENPLLRDQAVTPEELAIYYQHLYGAANEVVRMWYALAILVWEGILWENIDWNDPRMAGLKTSIFLPQKMGAPTVTVFGDMVDSEGRSHSVTVTDQTLPEQVMVRMGYTTWLWDEVSKLSHNHDFNKGGKLPYRNTAKGKKPTRLKKPKGNKPTTTRTTRASSQGNSSSSTTRVIKPKTPNAKAANNDAAKSNGAETKKRVVKMPRPKAQSAIFCNTLAEVRDLDPKSIFDMRVSQIRREPTRTGKTGLYFYGYAESDDGSLSVDTSDRIWVIDDTDDYKKLMSVIEEHEPSFAEGDEASLDITDNVVLQARKIIAANKTAFYRNLKFSTWE